MSDERDMLTALVVDSDPETADSIDRQATGRGIRVLAAADSEQARATLQSAAVDCLVVDPQAFGGDSGEMIAALQSSVECPIVLLTAAGPAALADETIATAATIVEKNTDSGDWTFLIEKIQSVVNTTAPPSEEVEMYRTLVETARDGLYRLDANGICTYLNDSFAEMLGYERGELLGNHTSMVMAEGELQRGQEIVQQVMQSDERESDIMDMEMETKPGSRLTVSIHFVVLTDEEGTYDGLMGVMRDITERKERERELRRQNERLDEFASIVSHDLRNPLNVAQGNLDLLARESDSKHLDPLDTALDRMETLIDETLELARQGETVTAVEGVALQGIIDGCWEMVATDRAALDSSVEGTVYGDPERVKQLFENLFRNAIEHGGPDVTVTVGRLDDGFFLADDGPGVADAEREEVFDPGYTTETDGTGFGLAIVEQIVEAHDWTISVTESKSGGARFEVTGVEFATVGK